MKTILLTIGMMLTALSGHAMPADTIYVMRNDGVMVPAPTFGSAESELITPRKHPDNLQVIPTEQLTLHNAIRLIRVGHIYWLSSQTLRM